MSMYRVILEDAENLIPTCHSQLKINFPGREEPTVTSPLLILLMYLRTSVAISLGTRNIGSKPGQIQSHVTSPASQVSSLADSCGCFNEETLAYEAPWGMEDLMQVYQTAVSDKGTAACGLWMV
ncbi:hypothetical protein RRG08_037503 [Elysia crispata]|uniref:Uncharacterized protein n=1 Tax=Elysia crispata TaxID=231223 RepID=A0AAE1A3C3_9GAST|nr:hypothetical protein RRG08_037503 [Elysia crispata]